MKKHYKRVLTIAGSDPSGGAGIQADLKTFSACGCYGMSAIVAVVDENTVGVTGVHPVPVDFVTGQIRSVLDDIGADAVKIGIFALIGTYPGRAGNFGRLRHPQHRPRSGDGRHLRRSAPAGRSDRHAPRRAGTVCAGHHSNIPEAEILLGRKIAGQEELPQVARELSFGRKVSVLLKAGHLHDTELIDVFYNAETDKATPLRSMRLDTPNTHGTGCTLSSAVAAFLAHGLPLDEAVVCAKEYINAAIIAGAEYEIGKGHGPVHHFFNFWE